MPAPLARTRLIRLLFVSVSRASHRVIEPRAHGESSLEGSFSNMYYSVVRTKVRGWPPEFPAIVQDLALPSLLGTFAARKAALMLLWFRPCSANVP